MFIDLQPASGQQVLTMTLGRWKTAITSSPNPIPTLCTVSFFLSKRDVITIDFHRSDVFAPPSKGYLFMMDALRFSPKGSIAWLMERGKHPAAMRMLENRACVGEVATKLIHDRRQEMSLNGGTPQKDILSLLGSFLADLSKL